MDAESFSQLPGSRARRNAASRFASAARRAFATLLAWQERGVQRRALARLDDYRLRDVGRTFEEAAREARKPVWRA